MKVQIKHLRWVIYDFIQFKLFGGASVELDHGVYPEHASRRGFGMTVRLHAVIPSGEQGIFLALNSLAIQNEHNQIFIRWRIFWQDLRLCIFVYGYEGAPLQNRAPLLFKIATPLLSTHACQALRLFPHAPGVSTASVT